MKMCGWVGEWYMYYFQFFAFASGASAQSAHMDTEDKGSLSVHVPLQPLHKGHGGPWVEELGGFWNGE